MNAKLTLPSIQQYILRMYEENPFLRPNPFRRYHTSATSYYSYQSPILPYSTHNEDRLQKLIKMNPFSLPYQTEVIKNNGIEEYKSGLNPRILSDRKFESYLPSVSFNHLTRIGGTGGIQKHQISYGANSHSFNFTKNRSTLEYSLDKDRENSQNKLEDKRQGEYQNSLNLIKTNTFSEKKISSEEVQNNNQTFKGDIQQRPESNLSSKIEGGSNAPGIIITNNFSSNLHNVSEVSKNSDGQLPQFKQEISLNQFGQAVENTVNRQTMSNYNDQPNQIMNHRTQFGNESAPLVSGIHTIQESKNYNDVNPMYPFESMQRLTSNYEISEEPSQIVVEGREYYRIEFKDCVKI